MEFGSLDCDESLHDRLNLLYAHEMVLIEILMIVLDPILDFKDLINFQSRIQILGLELEELGLEGYMNFLGILDVLD